MRDGEWLPDFIDPFLAATRTPAERLGDLSAQLGANEAGAIRLEGLCRDAGIGRYFEVADALLDYGERRMRAALAALPDGEYRFTDVMEWQGADLPITVGVAIEGDALLADFAGTASQVAGNINKTARVSPGISSPSFFH